MCVPYIPDLQICFISLVTRLFQQASQLCVAALGMSGDLTATAKVEGGGHCEATVPPPGAYYLRSSSLSPVPHLLPVWRH